ncbi:ABC transporter substrate-binding protein [Candidatus Pelagibacter sp.]|jgi:peptide/nickel transport system substrate-binding protein|nr:ABC transporter substrate-binding protein [Candidatus Pelagibacter sp.]
MKNIFKLISITLVSLFVTFSFANASSGVFKISHDLGFGKDTNLDAITKGRLFQVVIMTQNRLVRKDLKGVTSAELATDWSANADATEWTFNLRKGVKFHDGSDFDAEDVKYSLMRVKDPEIGSPAKKSMSSVTDIEVVDAHTVKMKLNTSFADFPLLLTDYRLRMIPNGSGDTIGKTGIGTGPFKVEKFDAEGTTILKANADYWEGAPGISEVHVIAIPDGQARVQALLTGQIDMNRYVPFNQKKIFDGNSKFNVSVIPTGNWRGMVMRTDTAPFDNAKVRKAVRIAVDRQELVDLVMGGAATVSCDTPVAPSDQYRMKKSCPQQTATAKKLLKEAGYPDGIEMTIHVSTKEPTWPTIAEVLQQQLAKANIKVDIQMTPSKSYWNETWMKKAVAMTRWNERPADSALHEIYHSGAKWNESYFKNPAFDQNLADARGELNFKKRKAAYINAQKTLFEEAGTLIPYHVSKLVVTSSKVKNLDEVEIFSVRWHTVTVN